MYYRGVVSKEVFASCDYHLAATLRHWAGRRHPNKGMRWVFEKYWRRNGGHGRLEFLLPKVYASSTMRTYPSNAT
jgi:hypothetical protein